ncbi:aminoglycoside phosphotransferase family protein [Streptomyces sp. ITFR-6]|uniref:phosphotransferase family protein n=1 Tax=Streptomyces sp. ITFR-6 TaxID=3075197 RepID=UPI00288B2118|nr:aminoglycoside phosphotransferase family protein [Streptomyces sp. ITFR-6]WNI33023.1 aminoglycoside phosphotransferase family protein [Streptomyces sp. ITFR-6]
MTTAVVRALGALAHDAAHAHTPAPAGCDCPPPLVLADRADGTVVRSGAVVAKAHAPGTDTAALAARLRLSARPALADVLLAPLPVPAHPPVTPVTAAERPAQPSPYLTELHGRPITLWPYAEPVDPGDPDAAPWEEAAALLARLHSTPLPASGIPGPGITAPGLAAPVLPVMRGPAKAALAVDRMRAARPGDPSTGPVLAAWERLPGWARDETPAPEDGARFLCHGDLHLGQLVRHPAAPRGRWLLIDVDDAGIGDATWDLARPAAWYAAGLLPPEVWFRFLGAYRAAGGPALPADGDPWPELDVAARALTVQTAALALAKSAAEGRDPDEVEQMMIGSCARIATLPPELATGNAS